MQVLVVAAQLAATRYRGKRKISLKRRNVFSTGGFSISAVIVAIAVPLGASPGARADICLLDAPAVHVDLGEHAAVTILAVRTQYHRSEERRVGKERRSRSSPYH